jgi:ornithine cyclodeaminase/alanine dehydrogenase-like protein (mu-crystallin family)
VTRLRVIDGSTIRDLAQPADVVRWMREAMVLTSRRDVELPLRRGMALPNGAGAIGIMPGYVGGAIAAAGVKLVGLVPPARRKGGSHLGMMILYDIDGLVPTALLCASTITAIRTAAATAVATDALARPSARVLALLGAGEQAKAHLAAIGVVRSLGEVRVWARDLAKAESFVAQHGADGLRVSASVADAVEGADIICTLTASTTAILPGELVAKGTHVNLVGASSADATETDDDLLLKGRYFVDYRPSAMDQAGELLNAIKRSVVDQSYIIAEIGEVLDGAEGRLSGDDITIYKSLGIAAQDIVMSRHVARLASEQSRGTVVDL